jgi:FAD/FMN-containing dehydrogenase
MDLDNATDLELRAFLEQISIPSDSPDAEFRNWARTFQCRPQRVFAPKTVDQCRSIMELARREGARVHPVGVGHSPSDLACTNGWLLRTEGLKGILRVRWPCRFI